MKLTIIFLISVLGFGMSQSAVAGKVDVQAGKLIASNCQGCHGPKGISPVPNYPNLAGQQTAYFVKSMHDYKSGTRKDPIMNGVASSLSDDDIKNLAAFYVSLSNK